jgi:hypothetical protein
MYFKVEATIMTCGTRHKTAIPGKDLAINVVLEIAGTTRAKRPPAADAAARVSDRRKWPFHGHFGHCE